MTATGSIRSNEDFAEIGFLFADCLAIVYAADIISSVRKRITKTLCGGRIISHIATVSIDLNNLDDLAAACKRIGLELVRGAQEFRYYGGNMEPCSHLIRIPPAENAGAFEIGLRRNATGGYELAYDFFGRNGQAIKNYVGENCNRLKQTYAVTAAARTARANGFRVQEKVLANGSIQLLCAK